MKNTNGAFCCSLLIPLFILAGCSSKQRHKASGMFGFNHRYTTANLYWQESQCEWTEAEYKQVEVGFKNNVQYIVIEMEGKKYSIIFPDADIKILLYIWPTSEVTTSERHVL